MSYPEPSAETVSVIREVETARETARRRGASRSRNDHQATAWDINVGYLLDWNVEVGAIKHRLVLLVEVHAIPDTKSEPTMRIELRAGQPFNRAVLKCIRSAAAHILRRTQLKDRLEVLVNREVKTDTRDELIRTIKQDRLSASEITLRIAVQDVAEVRGNID